MRHHRRFLSAAVVLLAALLAGCGTPVEEVSIAASGVKVVQRENSAELMEQWPSWRGPRNNGVAGEQPDAPSQWSSDSVAWEADVPGRGHGSPVVVGDLVFLATADEAAKQQLLIAYNRSDGEQRWSRVVHEGKFPAPREIHQKATYANSTVACDGQHVYCVFFNDGKIIASSYGLDGEKQWTKEVGAFASKFGYAPSPILYRSLVIVAADNRGGGYLAALDGKTGEIAWRTKRNAVDSYSSPFVAKVGGKEQLLISGGNRVCSYDPATGEKNWETAGVASATCGTLVTDGERIFASGGYPERQTMALSAEGDEIWTNRTKLYEPSLLWVDGLLIAVTDGGIAHCWDAESGAEHWKKRLGGSFSASPIALNGLVYVPDLSGKTYVFRASADGYEEVSVNRLGNDCYASIAAAGGQLFLRPGFGSGGQRQERLICIGPNTTPEPTATE